MHSWLDYDFRYHTLFVENIESLDKFEIIRFGIVGCVAVAVQYGTYWLCLLLFSHNIAFTIGYFASFSVNYLLTTAFTFKTNRGVKNGVGFAICHVINYISQVILLNLFLYFGLSKELAPIPVFVICVPTNFFLVRFVMRKL